MPLALVGARPMSTMMPLTGSLGSTSPMIWPLMRSYCPTSPKLLPPKVGDFGRRDDDLRHPRLRWQHGARENTKGHHATGRNARKIFRLRRADRRRHNNPPRGSRIFGADLRFAVGRRAIIAIPKPRGNMERLAACRTPFLIDIPCAIAILSRNFIMALTRVDRGRVGPQRSTATRHCIEQCNALHFRRRGEQESGGAGTSRTNEDDARATTQKRFA